jgi:hypothetical protein
MSAKGDTRARQDHKPYNPKLATAKPKDDTAALLDAWCAGVPTEVLAREFGLQVQAIRSRAAHHKAKRPSWYLSAVRGSAKQVTA